MGGGHIIVKNVKNNHQLIAISGPIGSGKSTITKILKKWKYQVFSFDAFLKKLYQPEGKAFKFVAKNYPHFIVDKQFQSHLVREKILKDANFLTKYQSQIWKILWKEFNEVKKTFVDLVFVEIPFFPSQEWSKLFLKIIFVKTKTANRILRISKRENVSLAMAKVFDKAFAKSFVKIKYSVIENNQTINDLETKIKKELEEWKKL